MCCFGTGGVSHGSFNILSDRRTGDVGGVKETVAGVVNAWSAILVVRHRRWICLGDCFLELAVTIHVDHVGWGCSFNVVDVGRSERIEIWCGGLPRLLRWWIDVALWSIFGS
jgi:hypothetical protein